MVWASHCVQLATFDQCLVKTQKAPLVYDLKR